MKLEFNDYDLYLLEKLGECKDNLNRGVDNN